MENQNLEPKTPVVNIDDIYLKDAHMFFPQTRELSAGKRIVFTMPRVVVDKKGRTSLKGIQEIYGKIIGKADNLHSGEQIEIEVIRAEGDSNIKKGDIIMIKRGAIIKSKHISWVKNPDICPTCSGANLVGNKFNGFCSVDCREKNWESIKNA